jgi:hypothetical protein
MRLYLLPFLQLNAMSRNVSDCLTLPVVFLGLMVVVSCNDLATRTSVGAAANVFKQNNINSVTANIPERVMSYIQTHLPDWKVLTIADYGKSWWSFYDSNIIPYAVAVDINDDQLVDYGVLMKKDNALQLVIIIALNNGAFEHRILNDFNAAYRDKDVQTGLMVEPPGQIDVVYPQERSLILPSNGIAVMELEVKSCIYYWQEGQVQSFDMK